MTGVVMAALGPTGGGGGVGNTPNPLAYSNLFDQGSAGTQTLTISGIGAGSSTISVANSGSSLLTYTLNGASSRYSVPLTVHDGDTLSFYLLNVGSSGQSGVIALTSGSTALGSFTYRLTGNNNY